MNYKLNIFVFVLFMSVYQNIIAYNTHKSQMEHLDRGLVVVPVDTNNSVRCVLSWRLFGYDPDNICFDILKNGNVITQNLTCLTFYELDNVKNSDLFQIVAKSDNKILDVSKKVKPWNSFYKALKLDRPQDGTSINGRKYSYIPNDCSVGDVDGDGEYEIFVKWEPNNAHDNSHRGYTGNVFIDCYKLNGTKLWRIDLGKNIRAGAHYTQFLVYDFNGDGNAELMCKTAPGSIDGIGHFVSEAASDCTIFSTDNIADYRSESVPGVILSGPEFLTAFDGLTGKALSTVYYNPNRAGSWGGNPEYPDEWFWGDVYGNRSERYLACVAYLDGLDSNPAAVFTRGYYTRAYLWAVELQNNQIVTKWLHASESNSRVTVIDYNGNKNTFEFNNNSFGGNCTFTCFGQGAHSIAVADVDDDGKDEIMFGAAAVDDNGKLLYSTGLGHGDAIHLSDLDPDRPGLEFFMTHEQKPYGFSLRDAKTGEILYYEKSSQDNGRGLAADIDSTHRGFEFWSIANDNTYNVNGSVIADKHGSINFRVYWDGDPYDELFDRGHVDKWNGSSFERLMLPSNVDFIDVNNSRTCNGTKSTPNLIADIFGDWREEILLWSANDYSTINIFTTNITPQFRLPTLMHDHVYRMSVCWQNVAYNQPPHLGYFLPDSVKNIKINL